MNAVTGGLLQLLQFGGVVQRVDLLAALVARA